MDAEASGGGGIEVKRSRDRYVSRSAAQFMRGAVGGESRSDLLGSGPLRGLVEAARVHRVQGYVVRALQAGAGADPCQLTELIQDYAMAAALHARAQDSLRHVSRTLGHVGVPWLALKGPVLTEVLHDGPGMRTYGDLDIIVAQVDLGRTLTALEDTGATPMPRSWRHVFEAAAGQLPVRLPNGQMLDLHWHLMNSVEVRRAFDMEMEPMIERGMSVAVGGVEVRTTDAPDTLVHLCVHAAMSGGNRLVWLKDIQLAAEAVGDRWNDVVVRAGAWRVGLVVAVMLARTRDVLGLELPRSLERTLAGGRAWVPVTRLVRRIRPMERSLSEASLDRMVIRSTRSTSGSSCAALARKVAQAASGRMSRIAKDDPVEPGGDESRWRSAFLGAVAGPPSGWDI